MHDTSKNGAVVGQAFRVRAEVADEWGISGHLGMACERGSSGCPCVTVERGSSGWAGRERSNSSANHAGVVDPAGRRMQ